MGEVTGFDVPGRRVLLAGGELPYDTLVLATGAENNYFGNNQWQPFAPGLKSVEEATDVRRRIFSAFEHAERIADPKERQAWLRFVIVGGGATGVELAGAIAEISRDTLRNDFRTIHPEESEILLLEGSPRVLPPFTPDLSEKAERALIHLGVRPRTGVRVTAIDADGVTFHGPNGDQRVEAKTVLWAAGVHASPLGQKLAGQLGLEVDKGGRLTVTPDLSLPGHPEILVLGDLAHCIQDGKLLPGQCPVAMQQGWYVGKTMEARAKGLPLQPFRFHDKGTMATIGRAAAVADLGFIRFDGLIAWLAWLFIHLLYIAGFRNRLLIALQWGFQYCTFNRGARLITGEAKPAAPPRPAQ